METIAIPCTEDGFPLVDMQVVGEVLERYPDLRMSYEEFLAPDEDFHGDWVDGRVTILGGETARHQEMFGFLMSGLWMYGYSKGRGRVLTRFQMKPAPDLPGREVDIMYLAPEHRNRLRDKFVDGPADLVMEVVSEFSRERDWVQARAEYERGGVLEYWIVDSEEERAAICRLNADGVFEAHTADASGVLRSRVLPGFYVRTEWLWGAESPDQIEVAREWGLI